MNDKNTVWGIHMGTHVGSRPLDEGYVAIGWKMLGDLRKIPADRDAFKAELSTFPGEVNPNAVPVHAGILYRFVHEMQAGDIVIYPSKHDRMVNIGRFTGKTEYVEQDPDD